MQARVDWVLIIFGTQVIKKKWPVRPVFPDYLSVSYDYVGINDLLTNNSRSGMDLFYNLKKITEKCLMFGVECFYFRAGLYH